MRAPTAPAPELPACVRGLRRVEGVRVIVGAGRSVAEVTGVAHRYPRTFRVSLAAAAALADAGVPMTVDVCGDDLEPARRARW
jgi:hypothetical protein